MAASKPPKRVQAHGLKDQILSAWTVHNKINLVLINALPKKGLVAVPALSRGRTVAEQLVHMNNVRLAWVGYHRTGQRPKLKGAKGTKLGKAEIRNLFVRSGKDVHKYLQDAITNKVATRLFAKNPVRWLGYIISHESHHRGQIMLALKQNGLKMPQKVALEGLWMTWYWDRKKS